MPIYKHSRDRTLAVVILYNSMIGGVSPFTRAIACYGLGLLAGGLLFGFNGSPEDGLKRADDLMYEDKKRWYAARERYR